jgi:hypothetical protein
MISIHSPLPRRLAVALAALCLSSPAALFAHCDGLDGPVVTAARQALAASNVNLVLIWVQPAQEPELRQTFAHCLAVRALGPEARELADHFFFETLVRIHRAGEGASYTGLKPAGRDIGPAIPAADRALETGEIAPLAKLLNTAVHEGLEHRFQAVVGARKYAADDVSAGRLFVAAYVDFIHFVERLHADAIASSAGHFAHEDPATPQVSHQE